MHAVYRATRMARFAGGASKGGAKLAAVWVVCVCVCVRTVREEQAIVCVNPPSHIGRGTYT